MRRLTRWLRHGRPFPYTPRSMGSVMALMWLVGGLSILLVALLPHPAALRAEVFVAIGASAPLVAVAIRRYRDRMARWMCSLLLGVGSLLITVLALSAGGGSTTAALTFFFVWIVVYALMFFSPRVATAHIGIAGLAYGVILTGVGRIPGEGFTAVEPTVLIAVVATMGAVTLQMAQAREVSETDPLTRVANRRGLSRVLDEQFGTVGSGSDGGLVLAVLDVDHFKRVNDTLGHDAGDCLLVRLADRWRAELRQQDLLARLGGDEFVVVLPRCTEHDAVSILERLRLSALDVGVTCSVGGARLLDDESASLMLGRADSALYAAKLAGRDRLEWA